MGEHVTQVFPSLLMIAGDLMIVGSLALLIYWGVRAQKMTPEGRSSVWWGKCPHCGRHGRVVFMASDGTELSFLKVNLSFPVARAFLAGKYPVSRCRLCNGTWQVWASPAHTGPFPPRARITETTRTAEPIGDDLFSVDNAGSAATQTRRLRVSKRWQQHYEVHAEQARTIKTGTGSGPAVVKATFAAEDAVKSHYWTSEETEHTFSEEIEFTIPPNTVTEIRLRWKRLWQEGYATVTDAAGTTTNIPFRAVVGVTFDQQNRDL